MRLVELTYSLSGRKSGRWVKRTDLEADEVVLDLLRLRSVAEQQLLQLVDSRQLRQRVRPLRHAKQPTP